MPETSETEPLTAACTLVSVSASKSASLSLDNSVAAVRVEATSAGMLAASSVAAGGVFTGGGATIVRLTTAVSKPPLPSEIVYENEAGPE